MPDKKATTDVFLMFIIGVIAALLVFVMIQRVIVKTLHGECVNDMQKETDKIVAAIGKLGNDGQTLSAPVRLGTCAEAMVFTSQERFYNVFKGVNANVDSVLKCPAGYKSMIAAVPFVEEKEKTGFWGNVWAALKGDFSGVISEAKSWAANAIGFGLKTYCKALSKPEYTFENDLVIEGSKTADKRYCLKVRFNKDGKFTVGKQDIKSESECELSIENNPVGLPITVLP